MPQSTVIFASLVAMFVLWAIMRGKLASYVTAFGIGPQRVER